MSDWCFLWVFLSGGGGGGTGFCIYKYLCFWVREPVFHTQISEASGNEPT